MECAAGSWPVLSVTAYAVRNSPSHLALLDASPLWDGALDMAAKLPGKLQSFRVRLLPLGGAVAQRLRGFQSAEPEKAVKRSSRRTGVNLQLFPVGAHFFRIVKGEQPLSSGLRPPASASCLGRHSRLAGRCPNNSSLFPPLAAVAVVALRGGWSPEVGRGESEHPSLPLAQRSVFAR